MKVISLTAAATLMSAGAQSAATLDKRAVAYALGNDGTTLVQVASHTGMTSAVTLSFDGGAAISLDSIAYRPKTGELYGYDDFSNNVYLIDRVTGMATVVANGPDTTVSANVGFDFNNNLDAARIVTAEDENLVFFPNNMPPTVERKTDLFYAAGDPNEGADPNVVMNAYTNAVPDATTTFQYVIDTELDLLASLANNAGTLTSIGNLTYGGSVFDITEKGGFDILSFFEGNNTAYALLTAQDGMQGIYSFALTTTMGDVPLTLIAALPSTYGELNGLAVMAAEVPVPATLGLLVTGIGGIAAMRRRRDKAA
ncbi:DUF4394 domain-containing protein [Pseudooceanicola sp. LIPI14-2-Ac024]|uniref:DUF4394 domain-containing protein n=1 Tax=Pseudooceanicola sp. LIPI14-2-Ac024 TaxID=3344875 RepID=UPI0035D0322B